MKLVKRNIPVLFAEVDEGSFVTCGRFTIADIYLWHILAWARGRGIALPDSVARYVERLAQRRAMPDDTADSAQHPTRVGAFQSRS